MEFVQIWLDVQQLEVPQPVVPEGQQTVFVQTLPFVHGGLQHRLTGVDGALHPVADGVQATPAGQHFNEAPLPQRVVPAGQPQMPFVRSTQAMPEPQHDVPHGVEPDGQQHWRVAFEQVSPLLQQTAPPVGVPDGQLNASARKGLSKVAAPAAATAVPITFSTPRRVGDPASARLRSSNRSLITPPPSAAGSHSTSATRLSIGASGVLTER